MVKNTLQAEGKDIHNGQFYTRNEAELKSHSALSCVWNQFLWGGLRPRLLPVLSGWKKHKLGTTSWKVEKVLVVLVIRSWPWASKGTSQQRQIASWAVQGRVSAASRMRKVILPLFSALVGPIWTVGYSSEPLRTRETLTYWSKFSQGPWRG